MPGQSYFFWYFNEHFNFVEIQRKASPKKSADARMLFFPKSNGWTLLGLIIIEILIFWLLEMVSGCRVAGNARINLVCSAKLSTYLSVVKHFLVVDGSVKKALGMKTSLNGPTMPKT